MSTFYVGDIRVDRVLEFEKPLLSPFQLLPEATNDHLEKHKDWLAPLFMEPQSGLLVLAMHSCIIHSKHGKILVDTCSGNDKPRPAKLRYHMNNWSYLQRFEELNVHPDEIDYVLCTHLHVDHVGWNTRLIDGRWVPTFKNAKYLFGREEWNFWQKEYETERFTADPYYHDSILPIIDAGMAEFIDSDYAFDDNVWVEPSPGHTPGHISVRVKSNGAEAVFTGDIMHHALQCAEPQLSSCFCVDADASHRTRRAFLESHADTSTLVVPAHFPTPTVGRIVSSSDSFRFLFDE